MFQKFSRREIQTLQQENYSLEKQLHTIQGVAPNNNQPQGPRTKSFENTSASSTASSGVGTSISSLNTTNTNLSNVNSSAPPTPNVVKKYYEQKYGSTTNMTTGNPNVPLNSNQTDKNSQPKNGASRTGSGIFNQAFGQGNLLSGLTNQAPNQNPLTNNQNTDNPLGAGLSSLTSQFTTGFANLKLSATNFQANKFTSKIMNPFSS